MKLLLLLAAWPVLAADKFIVGTTPIISPPVETALIIMGPTTNKTPFELRLSNPAPLTNHANDYWLNNFDWRVTNIQITLSHKPIVTESNGQWIIRFKP